jgi:hypothetical protein
MTLIVGLVFIGVFLVPLIFQLLWNITVPEIFGLKRIKILASFSAASHRKHDFRRS